MIRFTFIFILLFPKLILAMDLTLTPSTSLEVTTEEINSLVRDAAKKRVRIENKVAKVVIQDNRILADQYLKENFLTQEKLLNIKLPLEREFAYQYVKKEQEEIVISDDVILSYYLDKQESLIIDKTLNLTFYQTEKFQKAVEIYDRLKNDFNEENATSIIIDNNITTKKQTILYSVLDLRLKELVKDNNNSQILPPVYFKDHFTVTQVHKVIPKHAQTLKEATPLIVSRLKKATFNDLKIKLIEQYKKSDNKK